MEKFINSLRKRKLSENTIKTYYSSLKMLQLDTCNINQLKKKIFDANYSINTQWLHYNVAKNYFEFTRNKSMLLKMKTWKMPPVPNVYRKVWSKTFIYKKTELCENQNLENYYRMLIRFLFETGMRVSELTNILEIKRSTLLVKGKGNKIREIFYKKSTLSSLLRLNNNSIFNKTTKTLRIWIKNILHKEATPHAIRRSFATHMLLKGANPKHVMLQMGHKKIETTFQYLNLSFELNKNIYNKFI